MIHAARRCIPLLERYLSEDYAERERRSKPNIGVDDPYWQHAGNDTLLHAICDADPAAETMESAEARERCLKQVLAMYGGTGGGDRNKDRKSMQGRVGPGCARAKLNMDVR